MKPVDQTQTQDVSDRKHWLDMYRDAKDNLAHFKKIEEQAYQELTDGFTAETAFIDGRPVFQFLPRRSFSAATFAVLYPQAHDDCMVEVFDSKRARELYPEEYKACMELTEKRSLTLIED
jgi:hypothetical protein